MGLYSFLAKVIVLAAILLVGFVLAGALLDAVTWTSAAIGLRQGSSSPFELYSGDALVLSVYACVAVLFTVPASLALVGHAGAWLRIVAARSAKYLGAALVCACGVYLAGNAAVDLTAGVGGLEDGLEAGVLLVSAAALLLLLVSRVALLKAGGHLFEGVAGAAGAVRSRSLARASVELRATPTERIREKERPERIRSEAIRVQRLVQSLTSAGGRVEFRLGFTEGRGKVAVSVCRHTSAEELQRWLLSMVKAHLPEYDPVGPVQPSVRRGVGRCVPVGGVPEAVENPLEPLSRYFLENGLSGEYVAVLEKRRANPFRRLAVRAEQRQTAGRSGGQLTRQPTLAGEQRSTQIRDHAEEMRLEDSVKTVERHESSLSLRCWVWVTAYSALRRDAELAAKGASSVLVGALSGHTPGSTLKVGPARDPPVTPDTCGNPTLLLPGEAVPYAWMPQHAMGMAIVPSSEFELPPKLEGEILLGRVVVHSAPTEHEARIPVDALKKHLFLTGMTGTGKTTSSFSLLTQLYRLGVPFLVVEPVKSEYRALAATIPGLQVFTLGDEGTAPFRLNIFEPPSGVRIQTHLENLEAAWNASFVMYAPLPYVIKEVLAETYRASDWDLRDDRRGRPITLEDFRAQCERVSRRLGYEPKVTMDIEAALRTRMTSLTLGGKGPMFDSTASTPVEDVFRRPTVIELKRIPNNEEKAFVASLILMNLVEYIEAKGSSRQLRHVTVIEEAHRLLPNVSAGKGDPESADPRKRMVEQFASMLAEVRAYGEGLVIVEQIPTKIIPDAMKNTATKVAHRVAAADDREALAGAMNLTKEQAAVFAALQPGEAIVSLERHALPVRVLVPNVVEEAGMPVGEVGDEEVRRLMADYYLRNPLPKAPPGLVEDGILSIVDTDWFKVRFREAYRIWLGTGSAAPLADLLVDSARRHPGGGGEDGETLEVAAKILSMAVAFYLPFDEEDRSKFPRLFMSQVERSMRNGRCG